MTNGPPADDAEVDAQLDRVLGERGQAGGRVLTVQAEVEGEVVAGAGADDHERDVVLGGDPGHQCLGAVATGHAEQVGAARQGLPHHRRDVDVPGPSSRTTSAPSASAFSFSPNRVTLPPPERGS